MSEQSHSMTRGERRRRRETGAAARRVAEEAGELPLTRKEIRSRQLEEQARLEAIATGELPLLGEDGRELSPEEALAAARAAGVVREQESTTAEREPAAPVEPEPEPDARPDPEPVPEPDSAPSRRSMRERLRDADTRDTAPPSPGERTTTARRPVVRAPHVARGVRGLDATGTLTGIQPVRAPIGGLVKPEMTTDPAAWESAVSLAPVRHDGAGPGPERAVTPDDVVDEPQADASEDPSVDGALVETQAMSAVPTPPVPERRRTEAPTPRKRITGPEAGARAALTAEDSAGGARPRSGAPSSPTPNRWTSLAAFSAASGMSADEATDGADGDAGADVGTVARDGAEADAPAGPGDRPLSRRDLRERQRAGGRVGTGASAGSAADAPDVDDGAGTAGGDDVDDGADPEYVEDMGPRTPASWLVKIVALVLAAVVIGLLIGLLAFDGSDDESLAAAEPAVTAAPASSSTGGGVDAPGGAL